MIVGRWEIIWRPLLFHVEKESKIVLVCLKIHNFIIDFTKSTDAPRNELADVNGYIMEINTQDEFVEDAQGRRKFLVSRKLLEQLTTKVREIGMTRHELFSFIKRCFDETL